MGILENLEFGLCPGRSAVPRVQSVQGRSAGASQIAVEEPRGQMASPEHWRDGFHAVRWAGGTYELFEPVPIRTQSPVHSAAQ